MAETSFESVADLGRAEEADRRLEGDRRLLEATARDGRSRLRVWTCAAPTVVLGRSGRLAEEIHVAACRDLGVCVTRRKSGGGTVWIGPGTLQWAFALPHRLSSDVATIAGAKRFCNDILVEVLRASGHATRDLNSRVCGDLVLGDRKVGGLALMRRRVATLVHGSILCAADLASIDRCLCLPRRAPAYRRERAHRDFLANLGPLDSASFAAAVMSRLEAACASLGQDRCEYDDG